MFTTNMKQFTAALFIALFAAFTFNASNVNAQNSGFVEVKSSKGYEETVEQIRSMVSDGGLMVLSELNQGKILSMTGANFNAQSLFIGNPNIGKKAFSENTAVGAVIPVRLNIYERNGETYVSYFKPSSQFESFDSKKVQMIGKKMDKKLSKMTSMLGK